jgi:hypothetical protein
MPQTLDNIKLLINVRHTDFNVNNPFDFKTNSKCKFFSINTQLYSLTNHPQEISD